MTLKNDIAKRKLLSVIGVIGFCTLLFIPAMGSNETHRKSANSDMIMTVMANNDVEDIGMAFDNNGSTMESNSSILEEKIAIYPEFVFDEVSTTAYLIEGTNLKTQPYDNAEDADSLEKYQEVTLTGTNDLTYWEVSYNGNIYYINSNTVTTDNATVENMQEQERIAREEAERKAAEEAAEAARKAEEERIAATYNNSWNGSKLTPGKGVNYGPTGKETYYNLNMSGVVRIMRGCGNYDEYWVRADGVKMLGNYVMVAANLNVFPRGSLVECSLGTGIVCDTGSFAAGNPYQLDIAVTW